MSSVPELKTCPTCGAPIVEHEPIDWPETEGRIVERDWPAPEITADAHTSRNCRLEIQYSELMECVRYAPHSKKKFVLHVDGIVEHFMEPGEVVPYIKGRGYTVLKNGESI